MRLGCKSVYIPVSAVPDSSRYTPISQTEFYETVFRPIYEADAVIGSHSLAIAFMVMAIGSLLDLDRQSHSPEASHYYELGRAALAVDSVFEEQVIARCSSRLLRTILPCTLATYVDLSRISPAPERASLSLGRDSSLITRNT